MRRLLAQVLAAAALGVAGSAFPLPAQAVDSVLARIERMAISHERSEARVVADSLLAALSPSSPSYADALYWRGFTSSNAADAERDYLRVSVEFPLSARAPEALLVLAQLQYARGDRAAARRRVDRLLRDYPRGPHVARASYWSGRLAMDEGDRAAACASLRAARQAVSPGDVELANQVEYLLGQCALPVAPRDSATSPSAAPQPAARFAVQVAAYSARRDANALAERLKTRGFDVTIVGSRAPYRVRVGRYATRAAATQDLPRIRGAGFPRAFVVEVETP